MLMFKEAFEFFLNPETQTKKIIAKADFKQALFNINLIPFILAVLLGLLVSIASLVISPLMSMMGTAINANPFIPVLLSIGAWAIVLFPIASLVFVSVSSIVSTWILCLVIKLFGKEVSFLKVYYAMSVLDLALLSILIPGYIIAILLMLIPFLGVILYFVILALIYAVAMYSMYVWWVIFKQLTGFDNIKMIKVLAGYIVAAIIILIIILIIVVMIIILLMGPTLAQTGFLD